MAVFGLSATIDKAMIGVLGGYKGTVNVTPVTIDDTTHSPQCLKFHGFAGTPLSAKQWKGTLRMESGSWPDDPVGDFHAILSCSDAAQAQPSDPVEAEVAMEEVDDGV